MSKISIATASPVENFEVTRLIHQVTGLSLLSAKKRLAQGPTGIFYTTELFLNDHVEKDNQIRQLIAGFRRQAIELFIVEITFDMNWADVTDLGHYRISDTLLENVLDDAKGNYK
jgi:hypothetical protein